MIKENINAEGLAEFVKKSLNEEDQIFLFKNGNSANFVGNNKVIDLKTFNFFSLYDSNVFKCYQSVKKMLNQICHNFDINIKMSEFYISSQYFNEKVEKDFIYDFGGTGLPCFSGLVSLQKEEYPVYFNDERVLVKFGDVIIFEAGKEVKYDSMNLECIYFYIAPLFMLEKQYPQKWIPIGD